MLLAGHPGILLTISIVRVFVRHVAIDGTHPLSTAIPSGVQA
jgi:hypothetical protein